MLVMRQWQKAALCVLAAGMLTACASRGSRAPAPVDDRSTGGRAPVTTAAPGALDASRPAPLNADNAGRPGYYTVRPGDTLIRIALDAGQNWRDIARWNNLDNPNVIEVGQVLRITSPVAIAADARTPPVAAAAASGVRPAQPGASAPAPAAVASVPAATTPATPATPAASAPAGVSSAPSSAQPAPSGEDDVQWSWPTASVGPVLAGFDEQRNKGVDIAGKQGDAVLAAADGRVVYAGAGLRGYGNLIILKHNNTFLSAYAHNQTLLVKEDQTVRKGQKIAEMGSSDTDRVKLHFEIRRQGRPVDPARYLPMR